MQKIFLRRGFPDYLVGAFRQSKEMDILWRLPMIQDQMGASGTLVKMENGPSGGNCVLVYFICADCAIEAARAVSCGGEIVREKMSIGQYGFIALIRDTEGNMIGLHSMQ